MKEPDFCQKDLKDSIINRLTGNVTIIGMGNIIRGDDGLGPKVIELLKLKKLRARLFDCGSVPENYIFPILSSGCDTLIIIDAAHLGVAPGECRILDMDAIANISFSTHSPSPHLFIDLLKTGKEDLKVVFILMQPKDVSLGSPLSAEVVNGINSLTDILVDILS